MTDLDQLDIMRRAITALGLGQCAPEELVAEAQASSSRREQDRGMLADQRARIKDLEAKIATNIAEAAARDMRIAVLEAAVEATHKVFDDVGVAWSVVADAGRLPLPKRAEYAVSPGFLADAERKALEARIADLERDLTTKDTSLKTAHAALKRICEVIGAPVPCVAEDAVEAVKRQLGDDNDANAHAERAEAALAEIGRALEDAGAPQAYHLEDDTERPIPDPERIRLLGERIHTLRAQLREAADATNYLDALIEAHNALDVLKAPRLADGCVLSLAARIRALPR